MNNNPRPIIEWLASVGLDAQRIPAREPRLVRRDGGAWFLRFYEFALDADGRRILDGDGFAHTPIREVEVATLPPEPWLSDWVAPLDDLDDDAEWEARATTEPASGEYCERRSGARVISREGGWTRQDVLCGCVDWLRIVPSTVDGRVEIEYGGPILCGKPLRPLHFDATADE